MQSAVVGVDARVDGGDAERWRCRGAGAAEEALPGGGDDVGDEVVLDKDEGVGGETSGDEGRAGYVRRRGGGTRTWR